VTCSAVAAPANSPTSPTSPPADRPLPSDRRHHTRRVLMQSGPQHPSQK
jgi:hypothetical protein